MEAQSFGKIDPTLPFIKKKAIELLKDVTLKRELAASIYTKKLKAFYQKKYPAIATSKKSAIEKAGRELGWIYRRNIYPEMKLVWNSYPNHIGHKNTKNGCYRCHDDEHKTKKEEPLSQDCDMCHEVLAEEEEEPDVPESMLKLRAHK